MNERNIIESGILEQYVLGLTSPEETERIERLAARNPELANRIEELHRALNEYANQLGIPPARSVRGTAAHSSVPEEDENFSTLSEINTVRTNRWQTYFGLAVFVITGLLVGVFILNQDRARLKAELVRVQSEQLRIHHYNEQWETRLAGQVSLEHFFDEAHQLPIEADFSEAHLYVHPDKRKLLIDFINFQPIVPDGQQLQLWVGSASREKMQLVGDIKNIATKPIQLFDLPWKDASRLVILKQPAASTVAFSSGTVVMSGEW